MKKKILQSLLCLIIFALGAIAGWYGEIKYSASLPSRLLEIREVSGNYKFIHPLLYVDSRREAPEYGSLKKNLNDYIMSITNQQKANSVSVYFRDLNSGRWTGIGADTTYEPSSMLKVLVMMAYLREADQNPSLLLKDLYYKQTDDPGQYYKPAQVLTTGYHQVGQLIEAMIVNSDNTAAFALNENNKNGFEAVYKDLQLPYAPSGQLTDFMSPKAYSTLFRSLYNSTLLSRNMSEQALQLLTLTNFSKGLVAGLPKDVTVAHKFGEHTDALTDGTVVSRELHDCGIIYYKVNPYFLCVMTKGKDFPSLENIISTISQKTYETVSSDESLSQ